MDFEESKTSSTRATSVEEKARMGRRSSKGSVYVLVRRGKRDPNWFMEYFNSSEKTPRFCAPSDMDPEPRDALKAEAHEKVVANSS